MGKLFAFRGFADVPQGALATIQGLALVSIKLCLNLGFGVQDAGLELCIAALADTYRGKWRFFHDPQFALHGSTLAIK